MIILRQHSCTFFFYRKIVLFLTFSSGFPKRKIKQTDIKSKDRGKSRHSYYSYLYIPLSIHCNYVLVTENMVLTSGHDLLSSKKRPFLEGIWCFSNFFYQFLRWCHKICHCQSGELRSLFSWILISQMQFLVFNLILMFIFLVDMGIPTCCRLIADWNKRL